jgi:hypothetical protein
MTELLAFLRLVPELRKLLVAIGDLINAGRHEEAAEAVRAYRLGTAAGRAAYEASKAAGRRRL